MADVCVVIKKPNVMYVYMHVTKKKYTDSASAFVCAHVHANTDRWQVCREAEGAEESSEDKNKI
jgi:hypothetical protein